MELNSYLLKFGDCVRNIRKEFRMSQLSFYNYLFPDNDKTEENIKKKMNAIENGKQKSLDLVFLLALCDKCDVSADYILGLKDDYSNYDKAFVCEYTGLNENTVTQLHKWALNANNGADLSKKDEVFIGEEDDEHIKIFQKEEAINFLKIINYLFQDRIIKDPNYPKKKRYYSNLSVLHSIFLLTMSAPEKISGIAFKEEDDYFKPKHDEYVSLDAEKLLTLIDDNKVMYPVKATEIFEQIARNQLLKNIDILIEQIKKDKYQE